MRFPSVRATTALYEKNNYAYYQSLSESIIDFDLWFSFHKKKISDFATLDEMVTFMASKKYFEADAELYKAAVTKHFNNLRNDKTG